MRILTAAHYWLPHVGGVEFEAREQSRDGSDFLPVTYQIPVAISVVIIVCAKITAGITMRAGEQAADAPCAFEAAA